jgi:serine/threonine-protein kinase
VTDVDGQINSARDFGIARFATQVSGAASLIGTPAYLSPEQIKGETAGLSLLTIFSVGIVLYQLVNRGSPVRRLLCRRSSRAQIARQAAGASFATTIRTSLRPSTRIVMRCLAKTSADRYASGESLAASLYPFAAATILNPGPRVSISRGSSGLCGQPISGSMAAP